MLDDIDVVSLGRCCRRCRSLCDSDHDVWRPRCFLYGIESFEGWATSYKALYLGLLVKYGRLLKELHVNQVLRSSSSHVAPNKKEDSEPVARLWYAHDAPFGGLVVAKAEPPAIVLYSVIVHRINGPILGRPFLKVESNMLSPNYIISSRQTDLLRDSVIKQHSDENAAILHREEGILEVGPESGVNIAYSHGQGHGMRDTEHAERSSGQVQGPEEDVKSEDSYLSAVDLGAHIDQNGESSAASDIFRAEGSDDDFLSVDESPSQTEELGADTALGIAESLHHSRAPNPGSACVNQGESVHHVSICCTDGNAPSRRNHVTSATIITDEHGNTQGLIVRCSNKCRHMDFEPLLRHTGSLSGQLPQEYGVTVLKEEDPDSVDMEVPDIGQSHAQRMLRFYVIEHARFLSNYYSSGERGRYRSGRLLEGVQDGDLLYCPLKVGSGHNLAGLWRGCYGLHGIEILNFVLEQHPGGLDGLPAGDAPVADTGAAQTSERIADSQDKVPLLLGHKVTGDSNVPAGQISIAMDLSAPHPAPTCVPGTSLRLPPGCATGVDLVPGALKVTSVYRGLGHIAETGFQNDSWVDAEVIILEPFCMGIIWHGLDSFSLFSRLEL